MDSDKLSIDGSRRNDKLSIDGGSRHNDTLIQVEVAYARLDKQMLIPVAVAVGATAKEAIHRSGVLAHFPEINLDINQVGVFGKLGKLNTPLRAGDRVEIYRPLLADPKEMRRQRAIQGKKIGIAKMPKNQGEGVGSTALGVADSVGVAGAGKGGDGVPPGRV